MTQAPCYGVASSLWDLCTQDQYDAGKEELLHCLSCHYEQKNPAPQVTNLPSTNDWSGNDFLSGKSTPLKKTEEELNLYFQSTYPSYLSREMQPFLVLGAVNNEGDPQHHVIYTIGPVVKKRPVYQVTTTMPNTSVHQGIMVLSII